jgi:hypothetical protein
MNTKFKSITFQQHVINNPFKFFPNDDYFICSYKKLNKVKIQIEDIFLVDSNDKLIKSKPKHWIIHLFENHIANKWDVDKYSYFIFNSNTNKIKFISKPNENRFATDIEQVERSVNPALP